jgi:antitoxin (DNA-binding transcriptional repressor) of toxin-antitoxin stability system
LSGEDVIITKAGQPLIKLVPVETQGGPRPLGAYRGKVKLHGDLLEPIPEDILDSFWLKADE